MTVVPLHVLRDRAEAVAQLLVSANTEDLPALLDTDLPRGALQLLAGAYIEQRDQIRALHDMVDQTDPSDPIGTALTRVGLAQRPPDGPLSGPRRVPDSVDPTRIDAQSTEDLLALYCRVMHETAAVFVKYEHYIVRQWDGMDGCWTDCTGDVGREEALRYWAEKTDGGVHRVAYAEIDYYRIFPGGTRMLWDGLEGGELHR